jgi:Flp pilus assembly protein TadG
MTRPLRLIRDTRGASTVEFAMWSTLLFVILLFGADFGQYSLMQARLARGVSEASMQAFNTKNAIDTAQLGNMVASAAVLPGTPPSVSISCNGATCSNASRTCACLGSDGAVGAAVSCSATCATGAKPGYYLTIRASYAYAQPLIDSSPLAGKMMTQVSTVQLQ